MASDHAGQEEGPLKLCKELVIPLANHAFYHALPTKSAAGGASEEHEEDCECEECDDDDE